MLNTASNTRVVIPVALRALEAQRLVNLIAFKASPALAAGLIAYVHFGEVGSALLVAAAMLAALQLVERSRLPLGLIPAARLGLALTAPVPQRPLPWRRASRWRSPSFRHRWPAPG